jgi:hypothetical protein
VRDAYNPKHSRFSNSEADFFEATQKFKLKHHKNKIFKILKSSAQIQKKIISPQKVLWNCPVRSLLETVNYNEVLTEFSLVLFSWVSHNKKKCYITVQEVLPEHKVQQNKSSPKNSSFLFL